MAGTRYGASLRKQIKKMEVSQHAKYFCEFCGKVSRLVLRLLPTCYSFFVLVSYAVLITLNSIRSNFCGIIPFPLYFSRTNDQMYTILLFRLNRWYVPSSWETIHLILIRLRSEVVDVLFFILLISLNLFSSIDDWS